MSDQETSTEAPEAEPAEPSEGERAAAPEPEKPREPLISLRALSFQQELQIAAVLALLLVVFRFDAILHLGSHYLGGFSGDGGLYVWLIKHNQRDLFTLPWFNTHAFYPYARTLAWSDNFILPALVAAPLLWCGIPLTLTYNLLLLGALYLAGFFTARLCERLTGNALASLVGGTAFMCSSALTSSLGHPQLQFALWLPLAALLLFEFLARPGLIYSFLFGASIALAFLTTVHYALFIGVFALSTVIAIILLRPGSLDLRQAVPFLTGALVGAVPAMPFIMPYIETSSTFSARALYEAYYFSSNMLSYLSSGPTSLLFSNTAVWSHDEAHLFGGILLLIGAGTAVSRMVEAKQLKMIARLSGALFAGTMIASALPANVGTRLLTAALLWGSLASFAILLSRMGRLERELKAVFLTNRALMGIFLFGALLFLALSFGPLGNPEKGHLPLGPFSLFHLAVPGFNSMRAVSRFGIGAIFCLSVVLALTSQLAVKRFNLKRKTIAVLFVFLLAENAHLRMPLETETPPPPILARLTELTGSSDPLIILPYSGALDRDGSILSWREFARLNVKAMHWAFPLGRTVVNGYSGQQSKLMRELPDALAGFPDERSIRALRSIAGLRYILFSPGMTRGFDYESFNVRLRFMTSSLRMMEVDPFGNYLFELIGEVSIGDDYQLIAPSFPSGTVEAELRPESAQGGAEVELQIFVHSHFETEPYLTMKIAADGTTRLVTFAAPLTSDSVRPLRFSFKTVPAVPLSIGRTRFVPAP